MRYVLRLFLFVVCCTGYASESSVSVTLKPSSGIAGTFSFNIHADQRVTLLVYESASAINESPVSIDRGTVESIHRLAEQVLEEFVSMEDYSTLPEYKQSAAVTITQDRVAKSISTRRYSENLISLVDAIQAYVPEEYRPQLEKKES
jgi:hypothetical protein